MKTQRCQADKGRRGFTLVELVLVLVVLAVWAGIAMPRFAQSLSHHQVEAAARRIVRDLDLVRSRACCSSAAQKAAFDIERNCYTLSGISRLGRPEEAYIVHLSEAPSKAKLVSVDFEGETAVVFDGYGVPSSEGTVIVESGSFRETVVLDGQTGQASIQ